MTTTAEIISRVRLELGDLPKSFQKSYRGTGSNTSFEVPSPTDEDSLVVSVEGVVTNNYTLDAVHGEVKLDTAPEEGALVVLSGQHYQYFRDSEYERFVNEAVNFHTSGTNKTLANLPDVEVPLVAWLTAIEALWALLASASGDIDIHTPEGMFIPRSQRISYLTNLISMLEVRYKDKARQLNVGLHRIEVLTLRRVSRTTGKLVPIFQPQEWGDNSPPKQVWPPIDTGELGG